MQRSTYGTGIIAAACAIALCHSSANAAGCTGRSTAIVNGALVWKMGSAVGFENARLAVDADGAPNAYRVDGRGLSYTCDGVTAVGSTPSTDKDHWEVKCREAWSKARETGNYSGLRIFGFLTDKHNVPVVQKEGDSLPGAGYISRTTLSVPDGPDGTQRHWVDATQVPYVVLSSSFVKKFSISGGDLAVVYRPKTRGVSFAVFADIGKLGEGSIRLHQDLGSSPIHQRDGVDRANGELQDRTITIIFPGRTTHPTIDFQKWRSEIAEMGKKALGDWGGVDQIEACAR